MSAHGLLAGRRILVTGVLNRQSIAWHVAAAAQEQGAEVLLSSFGRLLRHTRKAAALLPVPPAVVELDVTDPATVERLADEVVEQLGGLDGLVHAMAFGTPEAVGGSFVACPPTDAADAFTVSAHSLALLAGALRGPLAAGDGGSVVGLTFESRFAFPRYNWMGVAKAALEATSRYTALELGPDRIRVNLVSAGPIRTFAARGVPGFDDLASLWEAGAPLGWDARDAVPVADACAFLLSDLARAVTGEILHVDGGMHAVAATTAPAPARP